MNKVKEQRSTFAYLIKVQIPLRKKWSTNLKNWISNFRFFLKSDYAQKLSANLVLRELCSTTLQMNEIYIVWNWFFAKVFLARFLRHDKWMKFRKCDRGSTKLALCKSIFSSVFKTAQMNETRRKMSTIQKWKIVKDTNLQIYKMLRSCTMFIKNHIPWIWPH